MTFPSGAGDAGRALLLCGLLVAGCAGGPVFTSHLRGTAGGREGVPYSLPMTLLDLELRVSPVANPADTGPAYEVSLQLDARRVPDPAAPLLLVRADSDLHSDDVQVSLTETGLLRTVNAASADETSQVVQAVARALLVAAQGRGVSEPGEVTPADELLEIAGTRRFVLPLHGGLHVETLGARWTLEVRCTPAGRLGTAATGTGPGTQSDGTGSRIPPPSNPVPGVIVRPPEAWVAEAALVLGGERPQVYARTALAVAAPDYSPWVVVPMDRAALVEVQHEMAFADGVLTRADTVRPGTALAAATAPYEIAESLVALPAGILQLKIDLTRQSAELAEERARLLEALRLLEDELARSGSDEPATGRGRRQSDP